MIDSMATQGMTPSLAKRVMMFSGEEPEMIF